MNRGKIQNGRARDMIIMAVITLTTLILTMITGTH